jgi:hypothetical protein
VGEETYVVRKLIPNLLSRKISFQTPLTAEFSFKIMLTTKNANSFMGLYSEAQSRLRHLAVLSLGSSAEHRQGLVSLPKPSGEILTLKAMVLTGKASGRSWGTKPS